MISIVIAEDQRMLLGALGALLDLEEDLEVIGQASNGEEAWKLVQTLKPDICLMDIEMPIKTGLDVAEAIHKAKISSKVVILTTFARVGYFERAVKAGVMGYLLKDSSSDDLADSIRNIMKGKREFAPELVFGVLKEDNPLTEREREVLKLIADGMTTKEVSGALYLSAGTVRNYMSEILNKLEVKNRIEAITRAKERGWII
ncbi:response regulator transcription factor [Priestia taiwanensis]|uniref:DNA-binding response regulator n=1 Tax=Priestia taiwanensis TaxID=1347902 RepID=A0A917AWA2_9BACI|nr:response regulator transcription factor [Priestia taiwanensis]MBM7364958.1 DNA-binding NarL/FixJ family response regulator [Priestia taiwanensis]GGE82208.1 DNA-binding response regulator [Priestia taiwanensis]